MNKSLHVFRTFENGDRILIGILGEVRGTVAFQYDSQYLSTYSETVGSLSPFTVPYSPTLLLGPKKLDMGLHGLFAESLPDGYGLWLMDRAFQETGLSRSSISPLDRLAFVGDRATGALSYEPVHEAWQAQTDGVTLEELGLAAQLFLEEQHPVHLSQLVESGSAGGSRPKAQIYFNRDFSAALTHPEENHRAWLVKFTAKTLPLGHEEGLFEAAALTASEQAGIRTPAWRLFEGPQGRGRPKAPCWLGMERFDRTSAGRIHYVSAAGLLNANFREPVFDYFDLMRLTYRLTQSQVEMEELFRRAVLSYFLRNEDDHGKNFGFLLHDGGRWELSPSFDITYAPGPYGEHATSFGGNGRRITRDALERMSRLMATPVEKLEEIVRQTAEAALRFSETALSLGAKRATVKEVKAQVEAAVDANLKAMGIV